MPHGTSTPVYIQFSLIARDRDLATLIYGHACYRAFELGGVQRALVSDVEVSEGRRVARVVYETNPAKIKDTDLIEWPSGRVICKSCLGRGEPGCSMCRGTGYIGEVY